MSESVLVRCPVCRREHLYTAPRYPCVCGAPVAAPLDRLGEPSVVTHRTWADDWITVRCGTCEREDEWPHPELGCACGTILRVPVDGVRRQPSPAPAEDPGEGPGRGRKPSRAAFQPLAIRSARDAVTVTALYLRWLGYHDIRRADQRQPNGIGLAARGILAQVDPTVQPASLRDVECLWLTAMSESAGCVYFSLAGYADDARAVADRLGVPLFVLDLTGEPQPVNSLADELAAGRT
ncbi:hypothetical protein [Streptomyces glomeratus]|uniref:Restriction endonuclease type IV Mrr domain-containing protein n=1 Tax=Streptomyces glomeratus TaxID=284452 RepID=A0ABP6LUV8_9ACTN|nr:hypothetical protein [Streptomyces glomeratus]MCF1510895.1 hypothetical protein [Streptomyces glomeratus]